MSRRPLSWNIGGGFTSTRQGLDLPTSGFVTEGLPDFQLDASDVSRGAVEVVARSPRGKAFPMKVIDTDGVFSTNFLPNEIGQSLLHVFVESEQVQTLVDSGRLKMREWKMRYGQKCKGGNAGLG